MRLWASTVNVFIGGNFPLPQRAVKGVVMEMLKR